MWTSIYNVLWKKGKNEAERLRKQSIYLTSVYISAFFGMEHTVNSFIPHLRSINNKLIFTILFGGANSLFMVLSELYFSFRTVITTRGSVKSMTDSIPISIGFFEKNTCSDGNSNSVRGSGNG